MAAVTLENISCTFGSFVALEGLSLHIASGEFLTLLGPSGCGKSTTLRTIAGLVRNTGGRLTIGSSVVSDAAKGIFVLPEARRLGMVFQSYAIWPHMTVFDNVAYPLKIRRLPRDQIRQKVKAALEMVELEHLGTRSATDLSGGQQQRVAIARALVNEPDVLLLDEPLSNLDARLRLQMGDEFRALQQRLGITTIYVTHDQAEAMALSDRVLLMHAGRVLQAGSPREIYMQPVSRQVAGFFGTPNFLEVEVQSVKELDSGLYELLVASPGVSGHCLAPFRPELGSRVTMMLRPEMFDIDPTGQLEETGVRWTGKVVQAVFRGPSQSVIVETPSGMINVEAGSQHELMVGQQVSLGAPLNTAWAVSES